MKQKVKKKSRKISSLPNFWFIVCRYSFKTQFFVFFFNFKIPLLPFVKLTKPQPWTSTTKPASSYTAPTSPAQAKWARAKNPPAPRTASPVDPAVVITQIVLSQNCRAKMNLSRTKLLVTKLENSSTRPFWSG